MFFAAVSIGCGGSSSETSTDSGQNESLNDDTGSTDPNSGGRGNSDEPVDLSTLTDHYTAQNGDILTGTLGSPFPIRVADGATITLRNVTINGEILSSYLFVGFRCVGDATLILEGTNYVQTCCPTYPAIYIPKGHTLTIKGTGKLTADASSTFSAGIGGGASLSCGNIEIEGGTIEARGGNYSAGIGGGWRVNCGNIMIDGGTINATGGNLGAGIGGGYYGNCGTITITKNVTKVTATKGDDAKHSIGAGESSSCGTVTVGDEVGAVSTTPYTYPPDKQ